jgi:hypothetical protein
MGNYLPADLSGNSRRTPQMIGTTNAEYQPAENGRRLRACSTRADHERIE